MAPGPQRPATTRWLVWSLCAFLLGGLLVGCSGVPNRQSEADAVTAALRGLPGVLSVDGRYTNEMTAGQMYNVDLVLDERDTADQVAQVVVSHAAATGTGTFDGHSLRLRLVRGADSLTFFAGRSGSFAGAEQTVRRWWELTGRLSGTISWVEQPDPETGYIEVNDSRPAQQILSEVRAAAADLSGRHWILRTGQSRWDLMGGYPADSIARTLGPLTATGQWSVIFRPAAQPTLELSVWAAGGAADEARKHLAVVKDLGQPVDYELKLPGRTAITVAVGGCERGGDELQQRLNAEFGNC